MESFFLSETVKYLYLLFDEQNPVNLKQDQLLFSTEGHIFPILSKFHEPPEEDIYAEQLSNEYKPMVFGYNESCEVPFPHDRLGSPLKEVQLNQYLSAMGVSSC